MTQTGPSSVLVVDVETSSAADIDVGAWAYSEHPSTDVLCVVFAVCRGPGDRRIFPWTPGQPLPSVVRSMLKANCPVVAFNYLFEWSIWTNVLVPRHGFPPVVDSQWVDVQALGVALNLPPTLEGLANSLGLAIQKDTDGAKLMRQMAKAQPMSGVDNVWTHDRDPARTARLVDYCRIDVEVTAEAYYKLPALHPFEAATWVVDGEINRRGVAIDLEYVAQCSTVANLRGALLGGEIQAVTNGAVPSTSSLPALKEWVKLQGVKIPKVTRRNAKGKSSTSESLDSAAIGKILDDPATPAAVRTALELRVEGGKLTSLAKLRRAESMTGRDGRLRGAFRYGGAHTGRWASSGVQLHNLPKPNMKPEPLAATIACVQDAAITGDLDTLEFLCGPPLPAVSRTLRSMIVAGPKRDLIAGDYSAIEARVIAWLAGQHDILDVFRSGQDVYVYAAERVGSTSRQLGKILTLALGYSMGAVKFRSQAAAWGAVLTYKEADDFKDKWRAANDRIVAFWHLLADAFRDAILNPGVTFNVGVLAFISNRTYLRVVLPSGRSTYYHRPFIKRAKKTVQVVNEAGEVEELEIERDELRYFTVSPDKRGMVREATYGGKLAENLTQAVARDVLAAALQRLRGTLYTPVAHVHDSVASEVPEGQGDLHEFESIVAASPGWADGLPISVEGYRGKRFRG